MTKQIIIKENENNEVSFHSDGFTQFEIIGLLVHYTHLLQRKLMTDVVDKSEING